MEFGPRVFGGLFVFAGELLLPECAREVREFYSALRNSCHSIGKVWRRIQNNAHYAKKQNVKHRQVRRKMQPGHHDDV